MSHITKQQVIELLSQIKIENLDIVTADIVSGIIIKDNNIGFTLELNDSMKNYSQTITQEAKALLSKITDGKITIVQTNKLETFNESISKKYKIPNVSKVIIVASGKGGVGKSSMTVGLAIAAKAKGLKVGIIDADINGPSIAHMFGTTIKPIVENNKIMPIEKLGVKFLSMGNLIDADKAIIWRSAMYAKALNQIISKSDWGKLDLVFVDSPPGTGDIHLTIAQNYYIDGVIIVSPPQKIAMLDVVKAVDMYNNLNIPIIGLVQNVIQPINPKNLVKELASKMNLKFLNTISFDIKLIEILDKGVEIEDIAYLEEKYKEILSSLLAKY